MGDWGSRRSWRRFLSMIGFTADLLSVGLMACIIVHHWMEDDRLPYKFSPNSVDARFDVHCDLSSIRGADAGVGGSDRLGEGTAVLVVCATKITAPSGR